MRWDQHFKLPSDSFIEVKLALREYRGQNKGRNLKKVEVSRGTAWPQLHCVCVPLCVFNCYGEVVISIFSQHDVVYKRLDYTGNTKTGSGSSSIWSAVLLRYHLLAVSEEIFGNIKYSYCLKVCVCLSVSPLLLSGLWSVLASLVSRWDTVVGSGVGLVLQLFSCFTGDESAMELWLLLSSSKDREIESPQLVFRH